MKIVQHKIAGAAELGSIALPPEAQLLLVFGARALLQDVALYPALRRACPDAVIAGCSTAGEICGTSVSDDSIVLTAVHFDSTELVMVTAEVAHSEDSRSAGATLSSRLLGERLRHVLVLSDGLQVNGSELVQGLRGLLPEGVNVTGGLAGDGPDFGSTVVLANGPAQGGLVAAIGFYSDTLKVGYGSMGGWDVFGPQRLVTRSAGNVLYELDGESALALYKTYLGSQAEDLPSSALRFPLALHLPGSDTYVVRTVLAVDEAQQSLTFAGDLPTGCYVQLMKANFNRLVDGAVRAAEDNCDQLGGQAPELAILISCVGRKLVLQQRIEEETEGVADVLGSQATLAGFYSYGEIAPHRALSRCELHNQTMTVTTFREE
ncbi:MAG: FIST signal transduction protein [Sphingomonadaceae bacterium]